MRRMDLLHGWWVILGVATSVGPGSSLQEGPCAEFYAALEEVPHVSLTTREGPIQSIWTGESAPACEVAFETNDATLGGSVAPDFWAEPGTATYRAGWRVIPEILADGPGSGVYGIQRSGVRCVIQWAQPAYIDDDGTLVQSETFSMRVQCNGTGRP
jgi:hypothetical protein